MTVPEPKTLGVFYTSVLGMRVMGQQAGFGYTKEGASLTFVPGEAGLLSYPRPNDRYWKIAISLPNLDLAYELLTEAGVEVTEPKQFREIAYLAHFSDPAGNKIELIQHTFQGKPRTSDGDKSLPLGGGARINLVTLRTSKIEEELEYFQNKLGMAYLSKQPVADLGFDLHFLAFTTERPPVENLEAVENRQWLWQRPYTVLEFQSFHDGREILERGEKEVGCLALKFTRMSEKVS